MKRLLRRAIAIGCVLGVVAGTAGAFIARESSPRPSPPVAVGLTAQAQPRSPLPHADVRIDVRAADPQGGAPWAMRTFASKDGGEFARCTQLGRVQDGHFGWITPDGAFRPALFDSRDVPTLCATRKRMKAAGALVERSILAEASSAGAVPAATITYGFAMEGVRQVRLQDGPAMEPGRDGAFLRVKAGEAGDLQATGELRLRDGSKRRFDLSKQTRLAGQSRARPVGPPEVAVRAPDPDGGLPWALLVARGSRGDACVSRAGRLLGSRLGALDRRLGLFNSDPLGQQLLCVDTRQRPTLKRPAPLSTTISSTSDADPAASNQLRRLDRRTIVSGPVHADVVSLTIRTPRDVRTLVPSRRGHAVIAVYDGGFPRARITVAARMRDGRTVTRSLSSGGA